MRLKRVHVLVGHLHTQPSYLHETRGGSLTYIENRINIGSIDVYNTKTPRCVFLYKAFQVKKYIWAKHGDIDGNIKKIPIWNVIAGLSASLFSGIFSGI